MNSDAIQTLTFKSGTTPRLTTTRSYDTSDRLDGITNAYGSSQTQSFGVSEFDDLNRRKKITREDNTRWNYSYNDKGEVTSGIREKTASPNTAVPGWSHAYSFDEIGNRLTTTTNSRTSTYTPNNLNQIANRTVPRAFDVIGKASSTAAVTVNGNSTSRLDEFFYKELSTGSGAVHIPYTIQATDGTGTTTRNGGKFLPATPETFTYDDDGNLTSDGRFTLTWNAENRLIAMETPATIPLAARRKLTFAYDSVGRRISKTVWHGTGGGGWQLHHKFDFIHKLNGWNILAERSGGSKDSFLPTYTWGTDLSGSLNGAGGVGGLLFSKLHTSIKTFANAYDLNGNVTLLVNTATGQPAATYDYGPFGEPLRQSGEYATLNPLRFSTKYTDDETGLVDYGHRYYIPSLGRWPSKDPIEEAGGVNLYGFVGNGGVNFVDGDGRSKSRLRGQLSAISIKYGNTNMAKIAKLNSLITSLVNTVDFYVNDVFYEGSGYVAESTAGYFNRATRNIILYDHDDQFAVHEVVHAWQGLRHFGLNDENAEGMAYATQYSFETVKLLAELETALTMHGGMSDQAAVRNLVKEKWSSAWLPSPDNNLGWEKKWHSHLGIQSESGHVNNNEIALMSSEFSGFGLKGKKIEEYFNSLDVMKNSCLKVSIDNYSSGRDPNTEYVSYSTPVSKALR